MRAGCIGKSLEEAFRVGVGVWVGVWVSFRTGVGVQDRARVRDSTPSDIHAARLHRGSALEAEPRSFAHLYANLISQQAGSS